MSCVHLENFDPALAKTATEKVCLQCIESGSQWVHLRTCQTCGITLCCDSSPHKHMTKHYFRLNHAVATSAEEGETWAWCYEHQAFLEW